MKNIFVIMMLISVMVPVSNAALVTITADGNIQNLPNPVHYVFSYDKNIQGTITFNGNPIYLNYDETEDKIVDYFFTEFVGTLILHDDYTIWPVDMWNMGSDLVSGDEQVKTSLSGGKGYHYVMINSNSNIDSWDIGTVLEGSEGVLQNDGNFRIVLSDLKITSITRSVQVPEPSTAMFNLIGGIGLILIGFKRFKRSRNI